MSELLLLYKRYSLRTSINLWTRIRKHNSIKHINWTLWSNATMTHYQDHTHRFRSTLGDLQTGVFAKACHPSHLLRVSSSAVQMKWHRFLASSFLHPSQRALHFSSICHWSLLGSQLFGFTPFPVQLRRRAV